MVSMVGLEHQITERWSNACQNLRNSIYRCCLIVIRSPVVAYCFQYADLLIVEL